MTESQIIYCIDFPCNLVVSSRNHSDALMRQHNTNSDESDHKLGENAHVADKYLKEERAP